MMNTRSRMKAQCEAQCILRTVSEESLKISPIFQAQRYNLRPRKGTTLGIDDDYASEIHDYHRSRESSTAVDPGYILNPAILIDETMRQILVNYLVEWHDRFGLAPETLFSTVSIVDRYLASEDTAVTKNNLQLVGIAALFIASKFEEEVPLQLSDAVYICPPQNEKEIVKMERTILKVLKYEIYVPNAYVFLRRYLTASNATTEVANLANYILDGTLQSFYLLTFLPSQLAAAAVFISRKTMGVTAWCPALVQHARYKDKEVLPVARAVIAVKTYCSAGLYAVNKKYAITKYGRVSQTITLCSDF